jgi:Protein of unknown function (DUF2911)
MKKLILGFNLLFAFSLGFSQTADTTRGSIPSSAELQLGKAGLRINYYSPAVRGRIIWNGLVPYDQVWVTGAHSATTIEFGVPVEINGKEIKGGKYALFTIPSKDEWTIIINKNWEQHLADEYSEKDDVVRIKVPAQESPPRQRLKYSIVKVDDSNVEISISWEKVKVTFPVKLLSSKRTYKIPKGSTGAMKIDPNMNMSMPGMTMMTHAFSKSLPMNRNGSGTGWLPDATPMYAWMKSKNSWNFMGHGGLFIRQNWQNINNDYKNGGKQFDAPGWAMGMVQKEIGRNGLLLLRGMISIDPITVGGSGYPLLFQTGESYKGNPLVDRQHPHDLISELSVGYTQRINSEVDVSIYIGYPGEPALGPTAFMHRISSINNPDAPLGHHWQDATHVTFGVATLGLRYKKFKIEASSFTGREPDEHRFDFDKPRFDSYSYRLSYAPNQNFVLQASHAFIKSPEDLEPDQNVNRTTASVIYSKKRSGNNLLTAALVWGHNTESFGHQEQSILLESNYQTGKQAVYGRYEWVEKSTDELQLFSLGDSILPIQSFTIGTNRSIASWLKTDVAIGAQATFSFLSSELETYYGTNPFSAEIYVRIIPRLMSMGN